MQEIEEPKEPEATGQAELRMPDGRIVLLPILRGSAGNETFVDIRKLYDEERILTFDPGFNSSAGCLSGVTYVDGDKGECLYRGYPVHALATSNDFLDVCYLLLYGSLPGPQVKSAFEAQVTVECLVHERLKQFMSSFVPGAHPMAILASVIAAFAAFYCDPMAADHVDNSAQRELACVRLIAKMPTVVAWTYKVLTGEPIVYPRGELGYGANFLHMMFSTPTRPYTVEPLHARILETFLIIHADHEQNASTFTVRTAGSSLANPYACIAAGVASLWGRAHGGANEAVVKMLRDIGSPDNIDAFVRGVKEKKTRLMGFGHRVYRNYDPRAKLMRRICHQLMDSGLAKEDPLLDLAMALEQTALADSYFIKRKLYPNVDFYSGIVMRALGIPEEMFTVMFAMGRCVGWLSHWKEMVQEPQLRICRPRQLYIGQGLRHLGGAIEEDEGEDTSAKPHEWNVKSTDTRALRSAHRTTQAARGHF